MILSIDVGNRNLGACLLHPGQNCFGQEDAILRWKVFQLPSPLSAEGLCDALTEILDEWAIDMVVIERQPGKSQLMQKIQYYCEMLFHCRGVKVAVMEARTKLLFASRTPWWPSTVTPEKWTYYARKSAAVKTARAFLEGTKSSFLTFFEHSAKRDDLADSLLQAMAHAHNFSALESGAELPKIQKARQPTARQLEKGKLNNSHVYFILKEAAASTPEHVLALAAKHTAFKGVLHARFANDPLQMLARFKLGEEVAAAAVPVPPPPPPPPLL